MVPWFLAQYNNIFPSPIQSTRSVASDHDRRNFSKEAASWESGVHQRDLSESGFGHRDGAMISPSWVDGGFHGGWMDGGWKLGFKRTHWIFADAQAELRCTSIGDWADAISASGLVAPSRRDQAQFKQQILVYIHASVDAIQATCQMIFPPFSSCSKTPWCSHSSTLSQCRALCQCRTLTVPSQPIQTQNHNKESDKCTLPNLMSLKRLHIIDSCMQKA